MGKKTNNELMGYVRSYKAVFWKTAITILTFLLVLTCWDYFRYNPTVSEKIFGPLLELNVIIAIILFGAWFVLILKLKKWSGSEK